MFKVLDALKREKPFQFICELTDDGFPKNRCVVAFDDADLKVVDQSAPAAVMSNGFVRARRIEIVAGVAALVFSVQPGFTGLQVQNRLESSATDLGAIGWDSSYGYGRVNAAAAISAAATVPPAAKSVTVSSGSPESKTVGTSFPSALQAKVTDASSHPVPNVTVVLTAPATGASATSGVTNTAVATNSSGIATSPVPTANLVSGSYGVSASVMGLSPTNFALTNVGGTRRIRSQITSQ